MTYKKIFICGKYYKYFFLIWIKSGSIDIIVAYSSGAQYRNGMKPKAVYELCYDVVKTYDLETMGYRLSKCNIKFLNINKISFN